MSLDAYLKLFAFVGAAIAGAIGTWKVLNELMRGGKASLREEYVFARDFLVSEKLALMPALVKEMGYQAIAGDTRVSSSEIEHLMTHSNSRRAIRDYIFSRRHLEFFSTAAVEKIVFKGTYRSARKRQVLRYGYGALYFLTYSAGFAPLLLVALHLLSGPVGLSLFVLSASMLFPTAFLALQAGARVSRAEGLIEWQAKTTQHVAESRQF